MKPRPYNSLNLSFVAVFLYQLAIDKLSLPGFHYLGIARA